MQIDLGDFSLDTFDQSIPGHKDLLTNFKDGSHSKFISMIDNRLELLNKQKSFPFDTAFVITSNSELFGYIFISSVRNDEVYLELSLLKEKRGKGYGKLILGLVTDYLFEHYNIRNLALDIDISNNASMNTAIAEGYYADEYLENGRIIFRNYNLNYVDKRKNKK